MENSRQYGTGLQNLADPQSLVRYSGQTPSFRAEGCHTEYRWSSFHSAPDAVNVILDMARKFLPEKRYHSQVENTALFCIRGVLRDGENRNPNLWHTIDMLIRHYDIIQTGCSVVSLHVQNERVRQDTA